MADELSGGAKCVKYILFLFNMLFLLAGLALIIVGALVLVHGKDVSFSTAASTGPAGIFIIVIGSIVFLVSFFGCAGAINNNYCMVLTYAVLLILLLIAEIAGVITGFVLKDKIKDTVLNEMMKTIVHYDPTNATHSDTMVWNKTQQEFMCCGVYNYTSWEENEPLSRTFSVPDSCCKTYKEGCGLGQLSDPDEKVIYTKGCYDELNDHMKNYLIALGAVAAGVAFIELIGILMACCLASHLRKDYRVV